MWEIDAPRASGDEPFSVHCRIGAEGQVIVQCAMLQKAFSECVSRGQTRAVYLRNAVFIQRNHGCGWMVSVDAVNIGFAIAGFMACSLMTISLTLVLILLRSVTGRGIVTTPPSPPILMHGGTPEYQVVQAEKDHWLDIYRAFEARGWVMIDKSDSPILLGYYDLTFRSRRIA